MLEGRFVIDTEEGTHDVTNVGSSNISFDATVASNGDIERGTMTVSINSSNVTAGTSPGTGTPFTLTSSEQETGVLTLGGGVDKLVAAGTVNRSYVVRDSSGAVVLSNSEQREVTWIFTATGSICNLMSGTLESAEGGSLMDSSGIPTGDNGSGSHYENLLVVSYQAWPVGKARSPDDLVAAVAQLSEVINQVLALESPDPSELALMIQAVENLRRQAATMDDCGLGLDFLTDTGEDTLAALMNELLAKALQQADRFSPQELIQLLNIGVRAGAVAAEGGIEGASDVYATFGEALGAALKAAIADADVDTVVDIAMAAGRYGFTDLYDQAVAAYKDLK